MLLTGTAPCVSQCVVCLFPVSYLFSLKDVLNNLPSLAAALAAGALHCQPRTWYAAGVWSLRRPRVRSLRRSAKSLQSANPVVFVFLVLFVCLCLSLASLASPSTFQGLRNSVLPASFGDLVTEAAGRRVNYYIRHLPLNKKQLICRSSGVDCRIQGSSGCVAVRHVSC